MIATSVKSSHLKLLRLFGQREAAKLSSPAQEDLGGSLQRKWPLLPDIPRSYLRSVPAPIWSWQPQFASTGAVDRSRVVCWLGDAIEAYIAPNSC